MLKLVHSEKSAIPGQHETAIDENRLFQGIIQGDMTAYETFYKLYYPRLFRFILRMTRNPDSVEELIQETLSVVWEKPDRFNHDSKISTWVFGIAYHKTLKSISQSSRRSDDVDVDELADILGDHVANHSQSYESRDWLNRALASLSPSHRAVMELTFCYELPYQEIAKILGCPENTVKTRMFHARKKLQDFVETQEC